VAFRKAAALVVFALVVLVAQLASAEDTPKAAETRKKLATKIDVDFSDASLQDAVDDLKEKVPALGIRLDTPGGVSRNLKVSFKGKQKTLAEVLDGMLQKIGCGYIVTSKEGDAYDGSIFVKQGKERGYAAGEEPTKADPKAKDAPTKTAKKTVPPPKSKSSDSNDTTATPEQQAALKLRLAKDILKDGKKERAKERLQDIVDKFPDTKAAEEARQLLKDIDP
jgi:TolA-binding protein